MSPRFRNLALGFTFLVSTLIVSDAHAIWPLSYSYFCMADSPTTVECGFTVTNPGPSGYHYAWNFADGSPLTGRSTSTQVLHTYAVSAGQTGYFNVSLLGYTSATSSLDNVIQCQVVVGNSWGVGGDPGSSGNCS